MSKKVSAQVASTQAPVKAVNVLDKKEEEEAVRQAQIAEAAGEASEAVAEEQVAEATPAEVTETAKTIAEVSQEIDATAESLAALDAPMMFAQAGAAAAGGGAAAGGISTAAIVAGVAAVGVAVAASSDSSSSTAATTTSSSSSSSTTTTGTTYALTLSSVTGAFDNLTGTANDDTFVGSANGMLVTGDVVDGAAGTDTISSRHTVAAAVTIAPSISNVEIHNVRIDAAGGAADVFTYDMSDISGATKVVMDRSVNSGAAADPVFTISGAGFTTAVTVGITGGDTGAALSSVDLTATYSGVSGSADAATLELNGAQANVVTIASIETLNITALATETSASSTGASKINSLIASSASAVNVTGAGAVKLSGNSNAQVAVDLAATVAVNASASTGGVEMTAETSTLTFTGGAGNDTVRMVGTLTVADTLTGGAGTDTLGVTTVTSLANGANVSGFEILDLSGSTSLTHVLTNYANNTFTGISITEEAATEVVTGLASGSTLFIGGLAAITANSEITVGIANAAVAGNNTDSLNVTIGGTAAVDFGTLVVASTESLSIVSGGATTGNSIAVLTAAGATNLTLSGASELTISLFTSSAVLSNINASAMTGAFVMGAAGVNTAATAITGGSGADALIGNSGNDVIIGGAGADTITGGTGADIYTGGAGADVFVTAPAALASNSVAASATSLTATIAAGDTMTFGNGVDIIRDFTTGTDTIKVGAATATINGVVPTALIGATAGAIAENTGHGSRGTFVESTGVFTFNTTGTDFLFAINDTVVADDSLLTNTNITILIGVSALVAADLVA